MDVRQVLRDFRGEVKSGLNFIRGGALHYELDGGCMLEIYHPRNTDGSQSFGVFSYRVFDRSGRTISKGKV